MCALRSQIFAYCLCFMFVYLIAKSETKVLPTCSIVKELLVNKFPKTFLTNWICLIQRESNGRTDFLKNNMDGSSNYGIFQINSYWCSNIKSDDSPCNMTCSALLDDDLRDDCSCANLIYNEFGFKYSNMWQIHCKNKKLPTVSHCPAYKDSLQDTSLDAMIVYKSPNSITSNSSTVNRLSPLNYAIRIIFLLSSYFISI